MPVPGRSVTRATAVLRLPVARYRAPEARSIAAVEIGSLRALLLLPVCVRLSLGLLALDRVGILVGLAACLAAAQRIDALRDDVHLEVRARHRRLHARSGLLLVLLQLGLGLGDDLLRNLLRDGLLNGLLEDLLRHDLGDDLLGDLFRDGLLDRLLDELLRDGLGENLLRDLLGDGLSDDLLGNRLADGLLGALLRGLERRILGGARDLGRVLAGDGIAGDRLELLGLRGLGRGCSLDSCSASSAASSAEPAISVASSLGTALPAGVSSAGVSCLSSSAIRPRSPKVGGSGPHAGARGRRRSSAS